MCLTSETFETQSGRTVDLKYLGGGVDRLGRGVGRASLDVLLVAVAVALLGLGRVGGLSLVGDVSDKSSVLVSAVGHGLDATVGEVDGVGA